VVVGAGIAGLAAPSGSSRPARTSSCWKPPTGPAPDDDRHGGRLRDRAPGAYPRSLRCRRGPIPSQSCTLGARS